MRSITLEVYHRGKIERMPKVCYVEGSKEVYTNYDPDLITIPDIRTFASAGGYNNVSNMLYKFEDEEMEAIVVFESDKDVINIFQRLITTKCKVLQVFIEHVVNNELEIDAPNEDCEFLNSDAEQTNVFFDIEHVQTNDDANACALVNDSHFEHTSGDETGPLVGGI